MTDQTMDATPAKDEPVPGRQCGTCTLCCKLLGIKVLNKPELTWCEHCKPGKGCGIYESRPEVCRTFYCGYRLSPTLGEEWYPAKSRMVLRAQGIGIVCYVDPGYPDAWKVQPYHSQLRMWAKRAINSEHQVIVNVGKRVICILPDKDVDLGPMQPGEKIVVGTKDTPMGPIYHAERMRVGGE
jgi:hypothetical protein